MSDINITIQQPICHCAYDGAPSEPHHHWKASDGDLTGWILHTDIDSPSVFTIHLDRHHMPTHLRNLRTQPRATDRLRN